MSISVNVHVRNAKNNVTWGVRRSPTKDRALFCYVEYREGANDSAMYFNTPDDLLEFITKMNQAHCDWLKLQDEMAADTVLIEHMPVLSELGGEAGDEGAS